jgi:hypothetical protein
MTTQLYTSLLEKNISTAHKKYGFFLNNHNKRLRIELYDLVNPPRRYHDKRMTPARLEEIAKETFTDTDFTQGVCADSGVRIIFRPKSLDKHAQRYFGHTICIDENSALTITILTGNDSRTLPAFQRDKYEIYSNKVMEEYLSNGKKQKSK